MTGWEISAIVADVVAMIMVGAIWVARRHGK